MISPTFLIMGGRSLEEDRSIQPPVRMATIRIKSQGQVPGRHLAKR
jgi:hypothetical protein